MPDAYEEYLRVAARCSRDRHEASDLVKQGVQVLTPVTEAPEGWSFELADPDGYQLAYFQPGTHSRRV